MEVIKEGTHTYLLKQIEYRTPVYDESVVHTQMNHGIIICLWNMKS